METAGTTVDTERYGRGTSLRRQVLGDEFVDNALNQLSDFDRDLDDLITEVLWGSVWSRDGLPLKTRSLLNLAMITILKSPAELAVHVRGARRNGCTVEEIRETLLHAALYAGLPAAKESFRVAKAALADDASD
jgi:4-carboxymuconolactone decarboxylase